MHPSHHAPGGVAGACGVVAGQPLDTVRIRQQAAGPAAALQAGGSGLALLRSIAAGEGVRHLFRGLTYPLLTAALQVMGAGAGWSAGCQRRALLGLERRSPSLAFLEESRLRALS